MRIGRFQPSQPDVAGVRFRFVARDVDGLPIVGETYNNLPRVNSFSAVLHRERAAVGERPVNLPIDFVGNKRLTEEGTYVVERSQRREADGEFEVTVSVHHVGHHVVRLSGPARDDPFRSEGFTWNVHVEGICPIGLLPTSEDLCQCDKGTEPVGETCSPCAQGQVKTDVSNDACISCPQLMERLNLTMGTDRDRTYTQGTGSFQIEQCACRSGHYLSVVSMSPYDLTAFCPHPTNPRFGMVMASYDCGLNTSAAASDLGSAYDALIDTRNAYCSQRACREASLARLLVNESGLCQACPAEGAMCGDAQGLIVEKLPIAPGYWHADEARIRSRLYRCCFVGSIVAPGGATVMVIAPSRHSRNPAVRPHRQARQ